MTVGIAAICDAGKFIVSATDGMLSAEVQSDVKTFKLQFLENWLFMFAGTLSNADLTMEEIRHEAAQDSSSLSREKIQSTLRRAYKKRFSQWSADRNLAPYDMEMREFKRDGVATFGNDVCGELARSISQDAANFNEEVVVSGWGKTDNSAMIYGMNRDGALSASMTGFMTIGSGGSTATSTLMLLGCARHLPLEYVLYAVAAAKFSSENCDGVGNSMCMAITRKPRHREDPDKWRILIQSHQQELLRELWNKHGRPKIPDGSGFSVLSNIAAGTVGKSTPKPIIDAMLLDARRLKGQQ